MPIEISKELILENKNGDNVGKYTMYFDIDGKAVDDEILIY